MVKLDEPWAICCHNAHTLHVAGIVFSTKPEHRYRIERINEVTGSIHVARLDARVREDSVATLTQSWVEATIKRIIDGGGIIPAESLRRSPWRSVAHVVALVELMQPHLRWSADRQSIEVADR